MKWIEQIKEFWLRRTAGDHPLTETERAPRPDNSRDRDAQQWPGFYGQSTHDPVADDDTPPG